MSDKHLQFHQITLITVTKMHEIISQQIAQSELNERKMHVLHLYKSKLNDIVMI